MITGPAAETTRHVWSRPLRHMSRSKGNSHWAPTATLSHSSLKTRPDGPMTRLTQAPRLVCIQRGPEQKNNDHTRPVRGDWTRPESGRAHHRVVSRATVAQALSVAWPSQHLVAATLLPASWITERTVLVSPVAESGDTHTLFPSLFSTPTLSLVQMC